MVGCYLMVAKGFMSTFGGPSCDTFEWMGLLWCGQLDVRGSKLCIAWLWYLEASACPCGFDIRDAWLCPLGTWMCILCLL